MPIRRGSRLDDLISRLPYVATPIGSQQWYSVLPYQSALTALGVGTPGAWAQMISTAQAPTRPFTVVPFINGNLNNYVEIGTGGAGAEVGIASASCGGSAGQYASPHPFPIIPGGTRVAFRLYSGNAGSGTATAGVLICLLPSPIDVLNTLRWCRKMARSYPGPSTLVSATIDTKNPQLAWTYTGAMTNIYPGNIETNPVVLTSVAFATNWLGIAKFAAAGVVFGEFLGDQAGTNQIFTNVLDLPVPLIVPGSTAISWDGQLSTGNGTLYYPRFGMYRLPQMAVW